MDERLRRIIAAVRELASAVGEARVEVVITEDEAAEVSIREAQIGPLRRLDLEVPARRDDSSLQ